MRAALLERMDSCGASFPLEEPLRQMFLREITVRDHDDGGMAKASEVLRNALCWKANRCAEGGKMPRQ